MITFHANINPRNLPVYPKILTPKVGAELPTKESVGMTVIEIDRR